MLGAQIVALDDVNDLIAQLRQLFADELGPVAIAGPPFRTHEAKSIPRLINSRNKLVNASLEKVLLAYDFIVNESIAVEALRARWLSTQGRAHVNIFQFRQLSSIIDLGTIELGKHAIGARPNVNQMRDFKTAQ